MPIDYKQYPPNWKSEIRPAIMARAGNRCEWCNVRNYAVGYRYPDGFQYVGGNLYLDDFQYAESFKAARQVLEAELEIWEENGKYEGYPKPVMIVLTVAHIHNHNTMDCRMENLAALCQKCHLGHDQKHHMENARETRNKKKGQQSLFDNG